MGLLRKKISRSVRSDFKVDNLEQICVTLTKFLALNNIFLHVSYLKCGCHALHADFTYM